MVTPIHPDKRCHLACIIATVAETNLAPHAQHPHHASVSACSAQSLAKSGHHNNTKNITLHEAILKAEVNRVLLVTVDGSNLAIRIEPRFQQLQSLEIMGHSMVSIIN